MQTKRKYLVIYLTDKYVSKIIWLNGYRANYVNQRGLKHKHHFLRRL